MEFIPHKKECKCNFCENKETPIQYAIKHAKFFHMKERCLNAINKQIEMFTVMDVDNGEEEGLINFMQCVKEETEKFENNSDVWNKL